MSYMMRGYGGWEGVYSQSDSPEGSTDSLVPLIGPQ